MGICSVPCTGKSSFCLRAFETALKFMVQHLKVSTDEYVWISVSYGNPLRSTFLGSCDVKDEPLEECSLIVRVIHVRRQVGMRSSKRQQAFIHLSSTHVEMKGKAYFIKEFCFLF